MIYQFNHAVYGKAFSHRIAITITLAAHVTGNNKGIKLLFFLESSIIIYLGFK